MKTLKNITIVSHTIFLASLILTFLSFVWLVLEYFLALLTELNFNNYSIITFLSALTVLVISFISSYILSGKYELELYSKLKDREDDVYPYL